MSYGSIEITEDQGSPVEIVEFIYSGATFLYTTSEVPIVYMANTYVPMQMKRGDIAPTGDATRANITLLVPKDCPVVDIFKFGPPSELVTITVLSNHFGSGDFITVWKGRITNLDWKEEWAELNIESAYASLQRMGVRRKYGVGCPHVLYSPVPGCGALRDNFSSEGAVLSLTGLVLSVGEAGGKPDDYYAGGYLQYVNSNKGNTEYRMIRSSVGSSGFLTLSSAPIGLTAAQIVKIYAGCDHSLSMCANKFNNQVNYGGMPFIPLKNPFSSSMF